MSKRILLDEMVPIKFRHHLVGDVVTVQYLGWRGTRNGSLLAQAADQFDVILTFDPGFEHEQNVAKHSVGVVLVISQRKGLSFLIAHCADIQATVDAVGAGEVLVIVLQGM
jgi:hypothetical protein